jgi:protein ImuB
MDHSLRLLTIWCPDWPMAAAQIPAQIPAAVVRARRVIARSPAAAQAGVRIGHSQREAQRHCPELEIHEDDPARTARNFEPVMRAVIDLAPRCEISAPGWMCVPVRGPARYFGGEMEVAQRLHDLVAGLSGWPVGVGIADGRFASTVAARDAVRSGPVVVEAEGSARFLRDRSLRWLERVGEMPAEMAQLCEQLGLRTCGDLAAMSAADLLGRFGLRGLRAHHLAAGRDLQPVVATDPPGSWERERVLPEPISQLDTVVFLAKQITDQLWAELSGRGRVCTRITVLLETEHGERSERSWYLGAGFRAAQMLERVRWQLEGWASTGEMTAGVVLIRLVAAEVAADSGVQDRFWGGRSEADEDALRAITRLVGMAGPDAVRVPRWQGGRLPDERYRWVPALSAGPDTDREMGPDGGADMGVAAGVLSVAEAREQIWPGALPSPSPAIVLTEPRPATVHDAVGRVVTVGGRGEVRHEPTVVIESGQSRDVVSWAGPWPLEQRWWDPQSFRRVARFQMLLSDGSALLMAMEHQQWWILAIYG